MKNAEPLLNAELHLVTDEIIRTTEMPQSENFDDIVAQYSPPLMNFIRGQVKSRQDAEDILQDVFYQLARIEDDDQYEIEKMSSWLYRVAHNLIKNFWRKKHEISLSTLFDDEDEIFDDLAQTLAAAADDSPETVYLRKLIWEELDNALAELPPEQREVFSLTVFDGVPVKDISAIKGVPVATLLSRKHYAVRHLRKRFHELYNALMYKD